MLKKFFWKRIKKKIIIGAFASGGRNYLGRVCVYHRGGGNKRRIKKIDRFRRINEMGTIIKIEKDSKYSAYIGMILYENGLINWIITTTNLKKGVRVFSGEGKEEKLYINGSAIPLKKINLFTAINNIEKNSNKGAKLARAAGVFAFMVNKDEKKKQATIKLASGWLTKVSILSLATLGIVSNKKKKYKVLRKAGIKRALGFRPKVRGIAKNPCDHPHGGGEGKGSPPVAQVSPWGKLTKGTPTKNKKMERIKRRKFKMKK